MTATPQSPDLLQDLERFVLDNPELERLEGLLGEFNPFVALRWTRQELRHSQFLRWILDPGETHGLGDYVLRAFVKRVAARSTGSSGPSVIEADSWSYSDTIVLSEWQRIDVLVRDDRLRFVLAIENKVDTSEHSDQLGRYHTILERDFPSYKKAYVYLTMDGAEPTHDGYVPVSHLEIAQLLQEVLDRRGDQLGPEVRSFVSHYIELLRRHIVEDSEIQALCEKIYNAHRRALDVLFEHRPDRTLELSQFMLGLVRAQPELDVDRATKSYIQFLARRADRLPHAGSGWTPSGRLVLFELEFSTQGLNFKAILGPGPQALRDMVHSVIVQHGSVFNRVHGKFTRQWWSFHTERWIAPKRMKDAEIDEVKREAARRFEQFVAKDLPGMTDVLAQLEAPAAAPVALDPQDAGA